MITKTERIFALILLLVVVLSGSAALAGEVDDISDRVVRLHVIANSDSEEDQACKLAVRDALIQYASETFGTDNSKEDTLNYIRQNDKEIIEIAQQVVASYGFDYQVRVELCTMDFDEKVYDNLTMPAGTYDAVRIILGSGEGKNWWCVMYPPLCLPFASGELVAKQVFTDAEQSIMYHKEGYEIRFALLDLLGL